MLSLIRVLFLCLLGAPHSSFADEPVRVAVAANVRPAFERLETLFEASRGIAIEATFGASGKFAAQIMSGAPFDIFLSADSEFPEKLHASGFGAAPPRVYALGTLVLWTMTDIDLSTGMDVLLSEQVRKVAIGNPKVSPYGRASIEVFEKLGMASAVNEKLVYGESLAQVMQFVEAQAAELGLTARSLVLAPELRAKGHWQAIPRGLADPIPQSTLQLRPREGVQPEAVQQFFEFLFSPAAQAILLESGYELP